MAEEIITAAILNVDLRDNLLVLSTHAHSGAAGMGDDELAGVDSVAFDDLAASPDAAGELQRNGVNLEWYGAAVVAITQADAIAATASPRTLGTGAQQAAAGNHVHVPANPQGVGIAEAAGTDVNSFGQGSQLALADTDYLLRSQAITPGGASRALLGFLGFFVLNNAGTAKTAGCKIFLDSVEKIARSFSVAATTEREITVAWFEANPTVAAHTFEGWARWNVANNYTGATPMSVYEVKA